MEGIPAVLVMKALCSVGACERPTHSHGLCSAHAHRLKRHGDPLAGGPPVIPDEKERWLVALTTEGGSRCRDWLWAVNPSGYGKLRYRGATRLVTHVVLELSGHPRPSGALALHSCHRPVCVAPWHLRWGTTKDNSDDKVAAARMARGAGHGMARLQESDVRAIRALAASGLGPTEIGARFGVSRSAVGHIVRRSTWGWVA